ncbi:hypothetical protein SMCB_0550 [Serpentinimonas maccroryi]|jgi:hypothetical protein|uniref:HEPN domain-containing protein n=1 Tax=Serpentinimonas maccroryi TaxID=1458426 RepID=A0A060NTC5_9BURK|nr:hypothetical protein [Serpentinimonas maccroryi]OYX56417.1 MAG: hypothetical protein B7Y96_07275 [Comamonadaceae bacterium 32-67-11]BAO82778.1 hypothetical protein SMCB_0550 [Serpentinimonas maccroryi]
MSSRELENLARIGQLKAEPRNEAEFKRMLEMARTRLADAQLDRVSQEGRFTSAYNAAHAAALAALRWHGYRSENRFTVFQCLTHTVGWSAPRWRVLDAAHQKRNLAEYEGFLEVEESTIKELCILVRELLDAVQSMAQQK